jgi:hypothetical protein
MHRFFFAPPDEEEEESARETLTSRSDDPKKIGANKDYPHECSECGRAAFICFTRPYCTNRSCKWYDKKRLDKPAITSYDPNVKSATVNPVVSSYRRLHGQHAFRRLIQ